MAQSYTSRYAAQILEQLGGREGYQRYIDQHGGREFVSLWKLALQGTQQEGAPLPSGLDLGANVKSRDQWEELNPKQRADFLRSGGSVVDVTTGKAALPRSGMTDEERVQYIKHHGSDAYLELPL